jgi:hypothetical protein
MPLSFATWPGHERQSCLSVCGSSAAGIVAAAPFAGGPTLPQRRREMLLGVATGAGAAIVAAWLAGQYAFAVPWLHGFVVSALSVCLNSMRMG